MSLDFTGRGNKIFPKSLDQVSNELKKNHHHAYFAKEIEKGRNSSPHETVLHHPGYSILISISTRKMLKSQDYLSEEEFWRIIF